ncbi:MAG: ATP-dependent DNA helicase [Capsulimonadaceae bacterium]|nr:ATP-dependent DNA helicase [Capsulimonadaceae bacterium]
MTHPLPASLASYFDEDGVLAKALPGYHIRQEQRQAVRAITRAIGQRTGIALVEAGTGVGKTLAYLLPAFLYARPDRKVIVSSHTLALQAQLWERDIPLVASLTPHPVSVALLKGRGNYLCLQDTAAAASELWTAGDSQFAHIRDWSRTTETGDVAELPFNYPNWFDVRADADTCRGAECRYFDACFYYKAKKLAEEAAIILVNHALYFSDLAVRRTEPEARILPDNSFVIFDEAHHLEDAAANTFGISLSSSRLPSLLAKVKRLGSQVEIDEEKLRAVDGECRILFEPFLTSPRPEFFLQECAGSRFEELRDKAGFVGAMLVSIANSLAKADTRGNPTLQDRVDGLSRQLVRAREELILLFHGDDPNYVHWGSVGSSNGRAAVAALNYTPVSVAPILSQELFSDFRDSGAVLISATLSTGGDFHYLSSRLGIPENGDVTQIITGSPFDYANNCLLYVPRHFPPPSDTPDYTKLIADEMAFLTNASRGGAFLLFTSHRMLGRVHAEMERMNLGYPLLRQGEMPTSRLIEEFRQQENAVLMGTSSFWEGVDVPGDALRLVVIDRLPFAMPDSPINKSRVEEVTTAGGDWFRDFSLPQAQLRLKQGFGRLIRTSTDKGVVAILDSRLATKNYGFQFLKHLPPARRTFKRDDAARFLATIGQPVVEAGATEE